MVRLCKIYLNEQYWHLTPTPFGEWVLVAEWGRIGSPGTVREQPFHTVDMAQAALAKRLLVKARRGYRANP